MTKLESITAFITTLDNKRIGVALFILLGILSGMSYSIYSLYNEAINTKNDALKEQNAVIKESNIALEKLRVENIKLNTKVVELERDNTELKNILKVKIK